MIDPLPQILRSHQRHTLSFPVHRGFFLIGCSATTYRGHLVASAWASDHVYNPQFARYENYVPAVGTVSRPGTVRSHRPPYLVELSYDTLAVKSVRDIVIESGDRSAMVIAANHTGFDGLKPWELNGELWCDFYEGGYGNIKFFSGRLDLNNGHILDAHRLMTLGGERDEKNWMPEVRDGKLRWHHRIGNITLGDGNLHAVGRQDWANINGGTQVVEFDDMGLAVVHDFHYDGPGRVYRHYFVRFDKGGAPAALSRPFVLTDVEKVEVVTGLARHNGRLIVSHGPSFDVFDEDDFRKNMQWDGVPQPRAPNRPPPFSPSHLPSRVLSGRVVQVPRQRGVRA